MAKIVQEGYSPVPEYDLICNHCETLSRYQKWELRFFEGFYDEELVSYDCPYCGKESVILRTDIPKPVSITNPKEIKKNKTKIFLHNLKHIFKNR